MNRQKKEALQEKYDTIEFAEKFHYTGGDLGAVWQEEQTVFRVWSPAAESVRLRLYRSGGEEKDDMILEAEMKYTERGVWMLALEGNLKGIYYTYVITVGKSENETADVYARACGANGRRSMVVNLEETDPEDFRKNDEWLLKRKELAECPVIYELHIKDFSHDKESGIRSSHRGKYLAFTEKGDGTGVSYLKSLGITHVHLLPFFDYGSVDETGNLERQFNWGYDPVHYNVPEGSYSTDPCHGEVRIRECKQMIQALHNAGIGVVMDVVYNHTHSLESVFQKTVPDYYYRMEKDGSFANGSLCGNDTASEREMYRRYMVESVCYWAAEYKVDGFRFDLMGLHDVETMNQIRRALDMLPGGSSILMYGEPWAGDCSPMRKGSIPANKENVDKLADGIAIFCDNTRDTVKGDVFIAEEAGFVNGAAGLEEAVKNSVCAWCREKTPGFPVKNPGQIITYISAHDNFTLWDKLVYTLPENAGKKRTKIDFERKDAKVLRQNKLAAGIYFTCLGTVFFQAGEEFARSKQGLENSYQDSPEINALSWERSREFKELAEFYRGLIHFRREWKKFFRRNESRTEVSFDETGLDGLIVFEMKNRESKKSLYILYNRNEEKQVWRLPEGEWKQICDGNSVFTENGSRKVLTGQIIVEKQAVMIFCKES